MKNIECDRKGCESKQSDYVNYVGFICDNCKEEFKKYLLAKELKPKTEDEIAKAICLFLDTLKGDFNDAGEMTVDEFFKLNTTHD